MVNAPRMMPRLRPGSARTTRIDRLGWRAGACFSVYGVRLGVRTNAEAVLERLGPLLPPGGRLTRSPLVDEIFSVWVDADAGTRPSRVYRGARRRARTRDLGEALAVLESEMRQTVAARAAGWTFVHAGVVGWGGRAIVIPGRSRSGKTTLVAELVRAGALYLSDEFAVLDARGRVHPFAKPLSIRGAGGCDRHARRQRVEELGGEAGAVPLPVALVVLAAHRPGATWRPRTLTAGQAVLELLAHTVPARLRPASSLAALERAVAGAAVLAGERGEASRLAPRLLRRLDETAPPVRPAPPPRPRPGATRRAAGTPRGAGARRSGRAARPGRGRRG